MKKRLQKCVCFIFSFLIMFGTNAVAYAQQASNYPVMYEITVGDTTRLVAEGEKVTFSMDTLGATQYSNDVVIEGDAGTLTVWASGKYFYWDIEMSIAATKFTGYVSGTNLTTNTSIAGGDVTGFSGSYAIASITGNRYSASLSGTAYLGPLAVAKTGYNSVTWTK